MIIRNITEQNILRLIKKTPLTVYEIVQKSDIARSTVRDTLLRLADDKIIISKKEVSGHKRVFFIINSPEAENLLIKRIERKERKRICKYGG